MLTSHTINPCNANAIVFVDHMLVDYLVDYIDFRRVYCFYYLRQWLSLVKYSIRVNYSIQPEKRQPQWKHHGHRGR